MTHLPLGTESVATVPLFNLWTLRWNASQLLVGYHDYWNAPIFYPEQGTFALSEPQPLTGLLFAPFYWLSGNNALAYNIVLLLILTGNGLAAANWLHRAGIGRFPSLLGGVLALALPFVSHELGVLQLTVLFPLFLSFSALHGFAQTGEWRSAVSLGWWTAVTFLTCSYYGLFLSLFLLLAIPAWGQRQLLNRRVVGSLLLGVFAGALLVAPILLTQHKLTAGYSRSENSIQQNSAQPVDYLRLGSQDQQALPWLQTSGGSGQPLYPGTGLLLLAMVGLLTGWQNGRWRWSVYCLSGLILAVVFSLGLNLTIGGWQSYSWLRTYYPGFAQLRSPFRLALFGQLFLVGLAGLALDRIWQWRRRIGPVLALIIVSISLLEVVPLPTRLAHLPTAELQADWIHWLAAQPAGAVAMIPFPQNGRVRSYEPTVIAMLQALEHGHPLANGYSGFFPTSYDRLKDEMLSFPDDSGLEALREAGVEYVVVDREWLLMAKALGSPLPTNQMTLMFSDETALVYRLTETSSQSRVILHLMWSDFPAPVPQRLCRRA